MVPRIRIAIVLMGLARLPLPQLNGRVYPRYPSFDALGEDYIC